MGTINNTLFSNQLAKIAILIKLTSFTIWEELPCLEQGVLALIE